MPPDEVWNECLTDMLGRVANFGGPRSSWGCWRPEETWRLC